MNTGDLSHMLVSIRRSVPWQTVRRKVRRPSKRSREIGALLIDHAKAFSQSIGGRAEAFNPLLARYVRKGSDLRYRGIYGALLDAFMPHYDEDLFAYYSAQQYHMLLEFLAYPFSEGLESYTHPYQRGLQRLGTARIVEYGAGIPFGLIDSLLIRPEAIKAITLIDLDLIHAAFTEFVIRSIAPNTALTIHKLNDTESFPDLADGEYDLVFGKDIFEHLHHPEENLKQLLAHCSERCICYLDIRDHGEVAYQHVTPQISHLADIVCKSGFSNQGDMGAVTEFGRGC